MVNSIVGIIGVRAEIIGVRQYLADGREIERINDRLAASSGKIEVASNAAKNADLARFAATKKANQDFLAASVARQKVIQAEAALAANAAKLAAAPKTAATGLVSPTGKPIASGATVSNAALLAEQTRLKQELKLAQQEFNNLASTAVKSGRAEEAAGRDFVTASAARSRALKEESRLNEELAATQRARLKAGAATAAIAGVAVIGATAGAAITQAAKYQQELSKINVLTSATDKETEDLGKQFLTLSTQIPVSASDLAATAYKLLSSGIKDTGVALEITTNAAKAAVAGQADIKDIVSATIAVLNGYPQGAITAAQANDILFAGVKEGAAEFDDFAGSIGKLIPIAAALGVPFDQLTASLAVLTNGGLNAEEAATGLRAILNDLAKDEGSKQAKDALASFGLTVEDVRKSIVEKGLPQAMADLIRLFNGNLAAIEPIIPNIRGMVAALSAFGANGKTTIGVLQSIDSSAGIVDQAFNKVRNNTANLAKLFSNNLNVALIEIGNAILPSVTAALQDLIKFLQDNRQEIQSFVAQGLQGIINVGRDAARGIKVLYDVFTLLDGVLKSIIGSSAATQAALAAIGVGLAFALPGGPVIVGLTTILLLLGQIQDLASGGGKGNTGRAIVQGVSTAIGAIGGGLLGAASFTPFGVGAGAVGGAAVGSIGGKALSDFLFGPEENKNLQTAKDAIAGVNTQANQLGKITLPPLAVNIGGVDQAAKKASDDLKKLAQDFEKTSEAAGQVKSLTEEFGKFGAISKQLADAAGLSAAQAGAVQGVDAVVRAQERAQAESFNYIEAINAVSSAWRQSAAVGREILFQLAQTSLEASQKALEGVFSRPTREVANLNVSLAQQQGATANLNFRNGPQITALQHQLDAINKQISQQNRANTLANRAAERAQREAQRQQKAQQDAQQAQLDALKLANLQAQIASERQLAALQKLIDANNKSASDLQAVFIKNNNDLQQQINTAIGKGDTQGALSLVDQQRKTTKEYRAQQLALQHSTEGLTTQQKAAQEAEAERQRQAQLAEALLQSQQKQQSSTDDLTSSLDDAKAAQDDQTQALEDSKDAIQAQIDALQGPIDKSKEQEAAIQRTIDVYEAGTNILKAFGVAADKTLLTQDQQFQAAQHFTEQISYASGQAQTLAKSFYDFIPGAKDANTAFATLKGAVDAVNLKIDPGLLGSFDAVKARLDLLAIAQQDATTSFNNSNTQSAQNAQSVQTAISNAITAQESILADEQKNIAAGSQEIKGSADTISTALAGIPGKLKDSIDGFIDVFKKTIQSAINPKSLLDIFKGIIPGHAQGGIFTRATVGVIGEAGPEAVLPLNDPRRMAQILQQASNISSNVFAFNGSGPTGSGYGGNMTPNYGITTIGGGGGGGGLVPIGPKIGGIGTIGGGGGALVPASGKITIQMPSAMTAMLAGNKSSPAVFAPNITVTGQTLDTMEATAIAAVQKAFRDARVVSGRSGGLITQGLGPSH